MLSYLISLVAYAVGFQDYTFSTKTVIKHLFGRTNTLLVKLKIIKLKVLEDNIKFFFFSLIHTSLVRKRIIRCKKEIKYKKLALVS